MSRRGGRGGKPSVSKELLKRSAQEAGLDDRHLKVITDITRPPLFPDFFWHSSGNYWEGNDEEKSADLVTTKRLASTVHIMNTQRELAANFVASSHYVKPAAPIDVIRYSDRTNKNQAPDAAVLASMGQTNRKLATDERYFPAELLTTNLQRTMQPSRLDDDGKSSMKLDDEGAEGKEDEEISGVPDEAPPEEEEDGEDYTTNYYNTDDDDSGGDDGEPTF